jgi:hypothetical protein
MVQIPPTPDIRQQRPELFQKDIEFPSGFAMPQGMQAFDPSANQWQHDVPDLWPEIQENLKQIMQQAQQPFYMPKEGEPLTPEQEQHNKMLMAWKSPAGLSAIETGKYREYQQQQNNIDRAEKRVSNLEKQLLQAFKAEAPKGLLMQIEKRYNASVGQLDTLLKNSEAAESGYPKFTGEGRMKLEGIPEKRGIFGKIKDWFTEDREGAAPAGPGQVTEPVEMQPGSPVSAVSDVSVQALLKAEQLMVKLLGNEKAQKHIDQIVAASKDPNQRLEEALAKIKKEAPKDPEVKELERRVTTSKVMQMPDWANVEPGSE